MTGDRPLRGATVLVTRPEGQAAGLVEAVAGAGGDPVAVPLLRIVAVPPGRDDERRLVALDEYDLVIFVSRNAARFGVETMRRLGVRCRDDTLVAAVGEATASALESAGVAVAVRPAGLANSEELLQCPALQSVAGRRVLIVRGDDGRELLADTLRRRGARVDYACVYRRQACGTRHRERIGWWLAAPRPLLTLTSVAALRSLLEVVPVEQRAPLFTVPTAVFGERIAAACRDAGWSAAVGVAAKTRDAALVATLAGLYQSRYPLSD